MCLTCVDVGSRAAGHIASHWRCGTRCARVSIISRCAFNVTTMSINVQCVCSVGSRALSLGTLATHTQLFARVRAPARASQIKSAAPAALDPEALDNYDATAASTYKVIHDSFVDSCLACTARSRVRGERTLVSGQTSCACARSSNLAFLSWTHTLSTHDHRNHLNCSVDQRHTPTKITLMRRSSAVSCASERPASSMTQGAWCIVLCCVMLCCPA
jgi:hypothetical protein